MSFSGKSWPNDIQTDMWRHGLWHIYQFILSDNETSLDSVIPSVLTYKKCDCQKLDPSIQRLRPDIRRQKRTGILLKLIKLPNLLAQLDGYLAGLAGTTPIKSVSMSGDRVILSVFANI